jgi:Trk-type K+ transport system membrane component
MRLRNRNDRLAPQDDRRNVSEDLQSDVIRAFVFWFFWTVYVCLSAVLIAALLTDWPKFLHDPNPYFK